MPPSLASIAGQVSGPCRMYRICGFDNLHTFYLGPARYVPDFMFMVFQREDFSKIPTDEGAMASIPISYKMESIRAGRRTVKSLITAANCRLSILPPYIGVRGLNPVRLNRKEKQARATGIQRRLLMPVLWVSSMRLNAAKTPDEDLL